MNRPTWLLRPEPGEAEVRPRALVTDLRGAPSEGTVVLDGRRAARIDPDILDAISDFAHRAGDAGRARFSAVGLRATIPSSERSRSDAH